MQTGHLILLAALAILSNITAKNLIEPRILNGQDAEEGQFPHMVSLRNKILHGAHIFGASILTARFLLTTAKCGSKAPDTLYAVVGALRVSSGGVKVELEKFMPHEKYDESNKSSIVLYDIAVIRTATEIIFTDLIQPIALPKQSLADDTGVKLILPGWGQQRSDMMDFPDILQYSEFQTISFDECRNYFVDYPYYHPEVVEGTLCAMDKKNAGDKAARACARDLGGALVDMTNPNHKTIVAIASYHVFRCKSGYPNMYSRIHPHLDWIQRQIESLSSDLYGMS